MTDLMSRIPATGDVYAGASQTPNEQHTLLFAVARIRDTATRILGASVHLRDYPLRLDTV
jgi:hypothetical protein